MAMNPRLLAPRATGFHPEANAWRAAVVANGGSVSASTMKAVSKFCSDIDKAGVRDRFLRLNLVCGSNLAAARTPLYRGASLAGTQYGSSADVNVGPFVEGDYSQSAGIAGNGTSKYFDTTLTLGSLASFGAAHNNVHVSVYKRVDGPAPGASAAGPDFGGEDYANEYNLGACVLDTSDTFFGQATLDARGTADLHSLYFESAAGAPVGLNLAQFYPTVNDGAYLVGNVSQDILFYEADSDDFISGDATPLIFCGAWSNQLDAGQIVDAPACGSNTLSAYSVGKAFTSSDQRTAFYAAMQEFQAALGRQV